MDEDDVNHELNLIEAKLINNLDKLYDFPKLLDNNKWKPLSNFEERKMTFIIKQKINDEDFVIKMRQNIYGFNNKLKSVEFFNEVIHEGFIGLFGINKLTDRKYSKSFAKIISTQISEICTPLVKEFSSNDGNCTYTIYEYISGETVYLYLQKDISTKVLDSIYLQLIKSLHYAYKTIDFTHYDLHTLNVIIHTTKEGEIYPVIIDYGSSHIKYKEKHFGRSFNRARIYDTSMWFHDIIKFLLNSYNILSKFDISESYKANLFYYYSKRNELNDFLNNYSQEERNDIKNLVNKYFYHTEKLYNIEEEVNNIRPLPKRIIIDKMISERRKEERKNRDDIISSLLPKRNYKFGDKIVELLKFFFPQFDDNFFREYKDKYQWFQIDDDMNKEYLKGKIVFDFDEFVLYAEKILQ
jgi:tRNA A-37 threonylcarbamoyl transferase component Bud32